MINWIVRIKNKAFWVALIPLMVLLIQQIAGLFGLNIDLGDIGNKIVDIINIVFAILALLGVVNDPTTKGLSDSKNALTYTEPKDSWK